MMIKCNETREKAVSNEEIKLHTKNQYQSEKNGLRCDAALLCGVLVTRCRGNVLDFT